ncbi:carboxypeptidase regulatory-like domain-containing protein, partial [Vibrio vulnificus]|nr:carboxypeptidase regulatory-like domain-containing protein [Vibrio vulnificus]
GIVFDNSTKLPIVNATVVLYDANYKELEVITTDQGGHFVTEAVECNRKFRLKASAENFLTAEISTLLGKEFNVSKQVNIG